MMESWERVTELFAEISDLPELEQQSRLAEIQNESPQLYTELASLLDFDAKPTPALDTDFISAFCALKGSSDQEFLDGPPRLKPGERIDDFEIIHEIGHGTFAIVYLAKQVSLSREVALKVSYDLGEEAEVLAHLEHENIIKVYSEKRVPDENGKTLRLICMQYISGVNLDAILEYRRQYSNITVSQIMDALTGGHELERSQPRLGQTATWVIHAITSLARALTYAHRRGVLHLDIKPSNILIAQDGKAYLMDFNVARKGLRAMIDGSQVLGGTQRYMAPEQLATFSTKSKEARRLLRIDHRADIYSFGRVVLEICDVFQELACNLRLLSIAKKCSASEITHRYPLTLDMTRSFNNLLEQSHVEDKLSRTGPISRFADAKPLFAFLLFVIVPQFFGSIFNIGYNSYQIVRHLSVEQQATFQVLLWIYNPIVYSAALALMFFTLHPTLKALWSLQRGKNIFDSQNLQRTRTNMLSVPNTILWVTSFAWVPSAIFFPAGLNLMSESSDFGYTIHFVISMVISWLIALAYSFLGMKYLANYIFFPKFVGLSESIQQSATEELTKENSDSNFIFILGGAMPLFAAILLLLIPTSDSMAWGFDLRVLTALMILCGTIGFVLSISAAQRIAKAKEAYIASS